MGIIRKGTKGTDLFRGESLCEGLSFILFKLRFSLVDHRYAAKKMFGHHQKCWGAPSWVSENPTPPISRFCYCRGTTRPTHLHDEGTVNSDVLLPCLCLLSHPGLRLVLKLVRLPLTCGRVAPALELTLLGRRPPHGIPEDCFCQIYCFTNSNTISEGL